SECLVPSRIRIHRRDMRYEVGGTKYEMMPGGRRLEVRAGPGACWYHAEAELPADVGNEVLRQAQHERVSDRCAVLWTRPKWVRARRTSCRSGRGRPSRRSPVGDLLRMIGPQPQG